MYRKFIYTIPLALSMISCSNIIAKLYGEKYYKKVYLSSPSIFSENIIIDYKVEDGRYILPITVDGNKLNFMFDTGARTSLNKNIVLYNYTSGTIINKYDIHNTKDASELINYDLELGNMKIIKMPIFRSDFSFLKTHISTNNTELNGILGSNILNQGVFYFDNTVNKLTISKTFNDLNIIDSFEKLPIKIKMGQLYLKVNREWLILDTGFNGFIYTTKKSKLIKGATLISDTIINRKALYSSKKTKVEKYNKKIMIGSKQYNTEIQCDTENNIINVIGTKFLSLNFAIDYKNNFIYLIKK